METMDAKSEHVGKIASVGVLDFTGMKSPAELSKITAIEKVGIILIPESLQSALAGISQKEIGAVVPLPDGSKVRVQTGQIQLSGDGFSNGEEDVILVVVGQLIITSKVTKIGFQKLIIIGQALAPKGSESVLGARASITGQVVYYSGDNPRIFMGNESLSKDFFELQDKPLHLLVLGEIHFESDVTVQLLKEKISGITLLGRLFVSKALIGIAQVLTKENFGKIEIEN